MSRSHYTSGCTTGCGCICPFPSRCSFYWRRMSSSRSVLDNLTMPREESIVETGKQRSLRVPLDHYRRPNPLVRGKYWLSAIFVLAALAYVVWLMLPTAASQQQVSPGPLAAAHSSWNNDCAACHQNLQPLRSDAVSLIGLFRSDADH